MRIDIRILVVTVLLSPLLSARQQPDYPLVRDFDGKYEPVADVESYKLAGKREGVSYGWLALGPDKRLTALGAKDTYTKAQTAARKWEKFERSFAKFAGHEQRWFVQSIFVREGQPSSIRDAAKRGVEQARELVRIYETVRKDLTEPYKKAKRLANPRIGDVVREYEENIKDAEVRVKAVEQLAAKTERTMAAPFDDGTLHALLQDLQIESANYVDAVVKAGVNLIAADESKTYRYGYVTNRNQNVDCYTTITIKDGAVTFHKTEHFHDLEVGDEWTFDWKWTGTLKGIRATGNKVSRAEECYPDLNSTEVFNVEIPFGTGSVLGRQINGNGTTKELEQGVVDRARVRVATRQDAEDLLSYIRAAQDKK